MAVVGELVVAIVGNTTGLSGALSKAESELNGFTSAANAHSSAAGVAGAAVAAGVAAISVEAIHMASQFQEAMSTIAVNAHLPEEAVDKLGLAIQTASIGTISSATDMAEALAPVAGELQRLSGHALTTADAVLLLIAAENLHVSAGTDLNTATKSIIDLLLTYRLHASDAAGVSNLLFAASAQLGTGVETVSGALQKLQPRIAGSGIDMITLLAIAREMEPVVGTGGRAIIKLGSVLQQFLSPSQNAQQVLSDLGVSLTDANGKFIGFGPAVQALQGALADTTPTQRAADLYALFGKNANIAGELIKGGAAGLAANTKALTDQGTAAAAAGEKNKDLANQGKILRTDIADLVNAIGGAFLPAISSVEAKLLPIINSFAAWVTANPEIASQLLLVAGALGAVVGAGIYLPTIFKALGSEGFLGIITSPILLIIGAVVALAATFGLLGPQAQGMANTVTTYIGEMVPKVIAWFESMIPQVLARLEQLAGQISSWIVAQIPVIVAQVGKWANAFIDWVGPMIPPALAALGEFSSQVLNWIEAQVPGWMAQVGKWASAFMGWVGPMIPPALAALGEFAGQVLNWISAQIPGWVAQIGKWAAAFIGWIGPMIPPALIALAELSTRVLNWILDQLPVWAAQLMKWADAFVAWVIPMIPGLLVELAKLGLALVGWIIGEIPHVVVALAKLAWELVAWVAPKIPGLLVELAKLGASIVVWIITKAIPAAVAGLVSLGAKFVSWVTDSVPPMLVELGKWLASLLLWLVGLPAKVMAGAMAIGASIINGIIAGIGTVAGAIGAWLFGTPMPAPPSVAPPPSNLNVHAYPSGSTAPAPYSGGFGPDILKYQQGGRVPGTGAQLAIVHGGETVIPAGQGAGGAITLVTHTHVSLDGREIMDFVEQQLFRNAGTSSSGFQANNPVTSV